MQSNSLDAWLTYIANLHNDAINLGLARVVKIGQQLGVLSFDCPVVLVAGTNGKGSTVKCLESIHLHAGLQVGCYTSPHITRFNERIGINGVMVEDAALINAFVMVESARGEQALTYFEFITLAALSVFKSMPLDLIVLEVGLGGRLDAVNCVEPDVSIITTVSYDHMAWLGDTLALIGYEKAGIMREGKPTIVGANMPDSVFEYGQKIQADVILLDQSQEIPVVLKLPENSVRLAMKATQLLGLTQDDVLIKEAVLDASLPGRMQWLHNNILLDVAHNPEACGYLAQKLPYAKPVVAILAMLEDKLIQESILPFIDKVDMWVLPELVGVARAEKPQKIYQIIKQLNSEANMVFSADCTQALAVAKEKIITGGLVVVFGSFYTVANCIEADKLCKI